jgi:radical SAM protein with 4Fe4S-binding SPASM domain
MHLFTNGTLLTLDKFKALIEVLDELIIDNYQQELKLIKPCLEIQEYCKEHPELTSKVTIVLRKPQEILTSRGGTAPNRKDLIEYAKDRCVLPFKQMIIRPTGQVSLCCNDAIGKFTLGNLNKESLLDIWYGPRFQMVRKCLYEGRENWGNCKYCDTFNVG